MPDFFPPLARLRPLPDGRLTADDARTLNRLIDVVNGYGRLSVTPPLTLAYDEASGPRIDFTAELGFWARLTSQLADPDTGVPLPQYGWVEQTFGDDGFPADDPAGRTDRQGQFPALEVHGLRSLPWEGSAVLVFLRPGFADLTYCFDFQATNWLRVTPGVPFRGRFRARPQTYQPLTRTWRDARAPGVWVVTPNGLPPPAARVTGGYAGTLDSPVFSEVSTSSPLASFPAVLAVGDTTGVNVGDVVLVRDPGGSERATVTAVAANAGLTLEGLFRSYTTPTVSLWSQRAVQSAGTFFLPSTADLLVDDWVEVSDDLHTEQAQVTAVDPDVSFTVARLTYHYDVCQVRTLDRLVFTSACDDLQWVRVRPGPATSQGYQPARVEFLPHGTSAGLDLYRERKGVQTPINVWAWNPTQRGMPLGSPNVKGKLLDVADGKTFPATADVAAGEHVEIDLDLPPATLLSDYLQGDDPVLVTDSVDPTVFETADVEDLGDGFLVVAALRNSYTLPLVTTPARPVFLICPSPIVDFVTPTGPPDADGICPAQVQSQDTATLDWSAVAPCLLEKANP